MPDNPTPKKDRKYNNTKRAKIEAAANARANQVLDTYANAKVPDAPITDLAAALWIKQWLGYTQWDGSGRGTPVGS